MESEKKIIQNKEFDIKRWHTKKYLFKKIEFKKNNEKKSHTERIQLLKKDKIPIDKTAAGIEADIVIPAKSPK